MHFVRLLRTPTLSELSACEFRVLDMHAHIVYALYASAFCARDCTRALCAPDVCAHFVRLKWARPLGAGCARALHALYVHAHIVLLIYTRTTCA